MTSYPPATRAQNTAAARNDRFARTIARVQLSLVLLVVSIFVVTVAYCVIDVIG